MLERIDETKFIIRPNDVETYRSNKCRRVIVSEIRPKTEMLLLEIGSGWGKDSVLFASCMDYFVALEINLKYCKKLKEKLRSAPIIRADGQDLPFRSAVFEASFCRAVLHHVPNPRMLISEMYRVIKKDSIALIIEEPNKLNLFWHIAKYLTRILHVEKSFLVSHEFHQDENEQNIGEKLYSPFCLWHLKEMFRRIGFRFIKGTSLWLPYFAVYSNNTYFKIWRLFEKRLEKTFIPSIFGQLFISGKK